MSAADVACHDFELFSGAFCACESHETFAVYFLHYTCDVSDAYTSFAISTGNVFTKIS